jgi:hypothetical protein
MALASRFSKNNGIISLNAPQMNVRLAVTHGVEHEKINYGTRLSELRSLNRGNKQLGLIRLFRIQNGPVFLPGLD